MTQPNRISVVVLGGINMDLVTVASRFPEAGETVVDSRFLTTLYLKPGAILTNNP